MKAWVCIKTPARCSRAPSVGPLFKLPRERVYRPLVLVAYGLSVFNMKRFFNIPTNVAIVETNSWAAAANVAGDELVN